ncbi:MAG: hypothetical protein ACJA2D_000505 [Pseudohongiellaceae bacterium]|jgi:hypothetical protein
MEAESSQLDAFGLLAGSWNINPFVGFNWLSAAEANAFRNAYGAGSAIKRIYWHQC